MSDVFGINEGHTVKGFGTGANGFINESEHTRKVGAELKEYLRRNGAKVINCTVDYANSTNESLELTIKLANNQELDWFVSIHFNAGKGEGVEVYTYEGRQYQDAIDVCKNISNLGFKNRGVKSGTGLYVIKKTKAKSMLIEVCFVDSSDASKYLEVGAKAIAEAIGKALLKNQGTPPNNIIEEKNFNMAMFGHIQGGETTINYGTNQCSIGTRNQSLRLEAFQLNIDGVEFEYMAHLQGYCDTPLMPRGSVLGTIGRGLRIEGFQINVTAIPKGYKLQYRGNLQGIGLTNWVDSGNYCGTKNESRRLEMIEVRVIKC